MVTKHKKHKVHWHKEIILLLLAIASVAVLIYEELAKPAGGTLALIDWFDFLVACIFLIDFAVLYKKSHDKKYFFRHNWYLLLASIPLYSTWATALRGLRVLRFIRLLRVGEHLEFSYEQSKQKRV